MVIVRSRRPSGQAETVYREERDARRAASIMHNRDMGSRYIECFFPGARGRIFDRIFFLSGASRILLLSGARGRIIGRIFILPGQAVEGSIVK